jgi:hypothetical protein
VKKILHTEGNELIILSTKKIYKGPYYIQNYRYYSGDNKMNQVLSEELTPITISDIGWKYRPTPSDNIPNENDYLCGDFNRYFCRKWDNFEYIEINEKIYNAIVNQDEDIDWESYDVISCNWRLTGINEETYAYNRAQIYKIIDEERWFGLQYFVREGYLKYYLPI